MKSKKNRMEPINLLYVKSMCISALVIKGLSNYS